MTRAVAALREPGDAEWLAAHVLYAHCRCSNRILQHLLGRGSVQGVTEHVLSVGPQPEREPELRAAGYRVHTLSVRELQHRFGAVAVPLLIAAGPDGRLKYVGGYTTHPQGPDIRDAAILRELMLQRSTGTLPLFGCAVSRELRELLDPLALKY